MHVEDIRTDNIPGIITLYPAEEGRASFSSFIRHKPKKWMNMSLISIWSAKDSATAGANLMQQSMPWKWYLSFVRNINKLKNDAINYTYRIILKKTNSG